MRKLISLLLLLCSISSQAVRRTYAIVVDPRSHQEARAELDAYADAVTRCQNLDVVTIEDRWGVPDSIRATLLKLYNDKKVNLVGAVFVGDIPIPMVRDAQHMASAFKMNQNGDWRDTSVPSDRFYDDFDLRFDFLKKDSVYNYFYYSLSAEGAQTLRPDIFSGRIRPTDAGGTSRYDKLRRYLRKATAYKLNPETVDNIVLFNGHGSLSESNVAHLDEVRALSEHFPTLFQKPDAFSYLQYDEALYIKERLKNELMRPHISIAMLHHHGDFDTQYLSSYPTPTGMTDGYEFLKYMIRNRVRYGLRYNNPVDSIRKNLLQTINVPAEWIDEALTAESNAADSILTTKMNLTLDDFYAGNYHPNCRFANFDACYNGSFHRDDCIANEYIFETGKAIAMLGGTVNVLQDKYPDHYMGLLSHGLMAGYLMQYAPHLEWHLIGDPTFAFAPEPYAKATDVNVLMASRKPAVWKKVLNASTGSADMKVMAVRQLADAGLLSDAQLLDILAHSPYGVVRLEAFLKLIPRSNDTRVSAFHIASHDSYELLQRLCMNEMTISSDPRIIPDIARLYVQNNTSARVKFKASEALWLMPSDLIRTTVLQKLDSIAPSIGDLATYRQPIDKKLAGVLGHWTDETNDFITGKQSDRQMLRQASYMRLYLPAHQIPEVARVAQTCGKTDLQIALLEALGWHATAYTAPAIIETARAMSEDKSLPAEVRKEALKTLKRAEFR